MHNPVRSTNHLREMSKEKIHNIVKEAHAELFAQKYSSSTKGSRKYWLTDALIDLKSRTLREWRKGALLRKC